ncbi:cupin domain-containing protein [Nonomuraea sp. NPDC049758]|uniref:cupin domain-containing protein n=1 Tax=Nonomuraea sp. NPDC049758 TaxID=3154360 RepID=UPI003426CF35
MADIQFDQIFPLGEPNDAYARRFIGQSYLAPPADGGGDQILMCTAGSGWYQAEGEDPVSMEPGTVIRVPAGTKHWHGATADAWFSHVAFITPGENLGNEWLEPVTDEEYGSPPKNGTSA